MQPGDLSFLNVAWITISSSSVAVKSIADVEDVAVHDTDVAGKVAGDTDVAGARCVCLVLA
jgi:hypothetical protein